MHLKKINAIARREIENRFRQLKEGLITEDEFMTLISDFHIRYKICECRNLLLILKRRKESD